MKLNILVFGAAQDIIGNRKLDLDVDNEISTVGQLKAQLVGTYPKLAELTSLLLAVNSEYAPDDTKLQEHDEIAIIPPTSGG